MHRGRRPRRPGSTLACAAISACSSDEFDYFDFAMTTSNCYRHNLTGPEDGPRATWAEGDHRDGLRIGLCASVLRAGMAVYLVRIV
jgi:hypothetical protein